MSARARARDHLSVYVVFYLFVLIWGIIWLLVGEAIFFHGKPPFWYTLLVVLVNPITMIWPFLISLYATVAVIEFLERQAERVGLAFWQFDRKRSFGLSRGLWFRSFVLIPALSASVLTGLLWKGSWSNLMNSTFIEWNILSILAAIYAIVIVLTAAHVSGVPVRSYNDKRP